MKKFSTILVILLVVIIVVAFAKDLIIKTSVEKGVEIVTGLKLNIGSLKVGVLKPVVDIKNLKLLNPANFPEKTMVDMPEIYVNYDLPAIMGGKIHLPEVRLALREFVVVKNAKGELNLDTLKNIQAQKTGKAPAGKAPEIQIDVLKLSIGKVIYKDYSRGSTPSVREFDVNLNESYTNVNNPYTLASLIVVKALMNTSIASLTHFDLKGLQGSVGGVLGSAQKIASTAVTTAQETAKQAAKTAADTAQKATDTVKGVLKNPFGSGK